MDALNKLIDYLADLFTQKDVTPTSVRSGKSLMDDAISGIQKSVKQLEAAEKKIEMEIQEKEQKVLDLNAQMEQDKQNKERTSRVRGKFADLLE